MQNQYDYLKKLQSDGSYGEKQWATSQLEQGMVYKDTKTNQLVAGCMDCAGEDDSIWYDVAGGAGGLVVKVATKIAVRSVAKKVANSQATKAKGNAPVPAKPGGGSNPKDFVNPHSEKHLYDPSRPSTRSSHFLYVPRK